MTYRRIRRVFLYYRGRFQGCCYTIVINLFRYFISFIWKYILIVRLHLWQQLTIYQHISRLPQYHTGTFFHCTKWRITSTVWIINFAPAIIKKINQLLEHGPVAEIWKAIRGFPSLVLTRTGDSNKGQAVRLWSSIPEYNLLSVFSDLFLKHPM